MRVRHVRRRRLRHALRDGVRRIFVAAERQRRRGVGFVIGIVHGVDRRAIAAQHRLADAFEINDDRDHVVFLLRTVGDRIADHLVGEVCRQPRLVDDALGMSRRGERGGGDAQCERGQGVGNA